MSLTQIEKLSEKFSTAAAELFSEVQVFDAAVAALAADSRPTLEKLVKKVAKLKENLPSLVHDAGTGQRLLAS